MKQKVAKPTPLERESELPFVMIKHPKELMKRKDPLDEELLGAQETVTVQD